MSKSNKVSSFKVGDVVKLPSEAKHMTVVSIDNDKIQCVWLNHELIAQYHDFEGQVLVHAFGQEEGKSLDRTLMEN